MQYLLNKELKIRINFDIGEKKKEILLGDKRDVFEKSCAIDRNYHT